MESPPELSDLAAQFVNESTDRSRMFTNCSATPIA